MKGDSNQPSRPSRAVLTLLTLQAFRPLPALQALPAFLYACAGGCTGVRGVTLRRQTPFDAHSRMSSNSE